MQFIAKARYIRLSPLKVRPLVDVVRGKNARYALDWLSTCGVKRAVPVQKMIESAVANAKHLKNIEAKDLHIKEISVDKGPIYKYFKAGAMGRSNIYRKRFSHLKVILESLNSQEV